MVVIRHGGVNQPVPGGQGSIQSQEHFLLSSHLPGPETNLGHQHSVGQPDHSLGGDHTGTIVLFIQIVFLADFLTQRQAHTYQEH